MNGAYSSLINGMPNQIPIPDQILNYGPLNTSQNSNSDTPLLSQLYNPAYAAAAAQNRILNSLHGQLNDNPLSPNNSNNNNNLNSSDETNDISSPKLDSINNQNQPSFPPNLPPNSIANNNNNNELNQNQQTNLNQTPVPFYTNQQISHPTTNTFQNNNNNNTNNLCCDFNSAWRSAAHMISNDHNPYLAYESSGWANPYGCIGNPSIDLNTARRKNATRESTSTLKAWLQEHIKNPYPTKGEKIMLAIITKMTLTQVSTWFANARRRLKKENKMTWSPKNRSDDDNSSEHEVDVNKSMKECENIENECDKKDEIVDSITEIDDVRGKFSSNNIHIGVNDLKPKIWSLANTATSPLFGNPNLSYPNSDSINGGPLSLVGNHLPPPHLTHQEFLDANSSNIMNPLVLPHSQYNYPFNLPPPPPQIMNNPPYHPPPPPTSALHHHHQQSYSPIHNPNQMYHNNQGFPTDLLNSHQLLSSSSSSSGISNPSTSSITLLSSTPHNFTISQHYNNNDSNSNNTNSLYTENQNNNNNDLFISPTFKPQNRDSDNCD